MQYPKILLIFLSSIFFQIGVHCRPPQLDAHFLALCKQMTAELQSQMDKVEYAAKVGKSAVVLKSQFALHIYAKIELLEGILAELNAYRAGFAMVEAKYFFDQFSVKKFLDYYFEAKGRPQNEPRFFSSKQLSNEKYQQSLNSRDIWIQNELIGRSKPLEFLNILEGVQQFETVPEKMDPHKFPGVPETYRELQKNLKIFVEKLKQEIVFGQTYNGFTEMSENFEVYKGEINRKIINAENTLALKDKMLAKVGLGEYKKEAKKFEARKGFEPEAYKELMLNYRQLNDVCAEMYYELMENIPKMIKTKMAKKGKTKLEWKTFSLGQKLKKAFAKMVGPIVGQFDLLPPSTPANFQSTNFANFPPKAGPSNANENGTLLVELIEFYLFLPDAWLNEEAALFLRNCESLLRIKIRLNAGMLLLAYERMKKFFDD